MRYFVSSVLVLALLVMGCSETVDTSGDGGAAGVGGSGGRGGSAGVGGGGSGGGPIVSCLPEEDRCVSRDGDTQPHEPCCEQTVPNQANACDGTESTENPATCAATGKVVTHRLTVMEVEDDCSVGYDLDGCDGRSCRPAPWQDGFSGVDNSLAVWGALLGGIGEHLDLSPVNQGFADALCGATDDWSAGTCRGGDNDGNACDRDNPCPGDGANCHFSDDDCLLEVAPTEIRFVIDANPDEGCANVTVLTDGEASAHVLNLSHDGCASGTLGTIPFAMRGEEGSLTNTVVRMTVSSAGFSHGQLGAAIDGHLVVAILNLIPLVDFMPGLDISGSTPPTRDTAARCDALSATFVIGGVAE